MGDELTEQETLEQAIMIMTHIMRNGTHLEIRLTNIHVSSGISDIEDIVRKYWDNIVEEHQGDEGDEGDQENQDDEGDE